MMKAINIRYGAIVIYPDNRIVDYGNVLAIARAEAQIKEGTTKKIEIKSILFDPICKVFIAIYPIFNSNDQSYSKLLLQEGGKNEE